MGKTTLGIALGVFTLLTSACGPSRESVVARIATHDEQLRTRAAFDLQCPKDTLQVTPLKQRPTAFHEDVQYTVVAGVTGCDRQVTYVYDEIRGVWILDSDSRPAKR
ncbi:MAG: hypothetical protein U0169_05320 [Polyangiaceae bacterium]